MTLKCSTVVAHGRQCEVCKMQSDNDFKYCPNCGAKMDLEVRQ